MRYIPFDCENFSNTLKTTYTMIDSPEWQEAKEKEEFDKLIKLLQVYFKGE